MNKGLWESTTYSIPLITDDGTKLVATATDKYRNNNKASKLNGRVHTMDLLQMMSEITKSSKDILILKSIIKETDIANEIKLVNVEKFAVKANTSVESLRKVLTRACEIGLLHKLDTAYYMLNPFVLLSQGLTFAKDGRQFDVQVRWRELTNVYTESDIIALDNLASFVNAETLPPLPILISIANQYKSKGMVTDKQKAVVLKYVCDNKEQ